MAPGILYVTMQPKPELPFEQFEDWYNNEHGPLRLRLSFCENGFRYRATDLDGPGKGQHEWMAIYDLDDMDKLNGDEYLKLRGPPVQTQREVDIRPYLDINRRNFDLLSDRKTDDYQPVERIGGEDAGNVMVHVAFTVKPDQDPEEIGRWYDEEHTAMLQKVPGWRRTRRFKTSSIEKSQVTEYLALHEYAPKNGLAGPEFVAATTTPWAHKVNNEVIASKHRRVYSHYYTFGPAPRHLSSITNWSSPATLTRTLSTTPSILESYITTPDGARINYHLTGSSSPTAPVVLCLPSILSHHSIYSSFTSHLLSKHPHLRVLRYNTRGRTSSLGTTTPITLQTLTSDALSLLDALRIPSVALAIGVSLGGVTVLNLGLKHPSRVPVFLACDTNAKAPPSNPKAWGERIAMAEADASAASTTTGAYGGPSEDAFVATVEKGDKVVGEELAEATVRRWFVKESYDGGELEARVKEVKEMVRSNSLEGFKGSVRALYEYDITAELEGCKARGEFLVGAGDGVLPEGMKKMAAQLGDGKGGKGVKCTVVEGAGHLPMVERPEEVAQAVIKMLES
ncbi:hypothetical protein CAC42_7048 [Sphaceloma murrayae]|uniref:AB hydrolase-1 domain-containing protein n=1 Tax=Sphaceloma murrayae TaxID=2082308 RepID=A0A2K1QQP6_9PEZI|nr:hypothetical protein CAC42_7048 [Sphaceloma murrayae]